jgi:type IV pilus assembly protein PilY1
MKPKLPLLLLIVLISYASARPGRAAVMEDYCSVPPSVSSGIAPNILIVMDTSSDMVNGPAHSTPDPAGSLTPTTYSYAQGLVRDIYDPTKQADYVGYFKQEACYEYSSNEFKEVLNGSVIPARSYTVSETCPSDAPFRGSLMNWAAISMYDVLQMILVGGKSQSPQGNAHTLESIANSWIQTSTAPKNGLYVAQKVYNGCIFEGEGKGSSNTVTIRDETANACALLDAPRSSIADAAPSGWMRLFAWISAQMDRWVAWIPDRVKEPLAAAVAWVEDTDWISLAWASHTLAIDTGGSTNFTGTVGVDLTPIAMTCAGTTKELCPDGTYTWTFTGLPTWLTPAYTNNSNNKQVNRNATLSGTPAAAGTYTFDVVLSISGSKKTHTGSDPVTIVIVVSEPPSSSVCGNGLLETGEQCDDYNLLNGDGCSEVCQTEVPPTPAPGTLRSESFTIKVELIEETFSDYNGNDIWDPGEEFNLADDLNGNGVWDGKQGVIQKFSDAYNPKANWGVMTLDTGGGGDDFKISSSGCIPAGIPQPSSFYTEIQNSAADDKANLTNAVFAGINYYSQGQITPTPSGAPGYTGCTGKDPMDDVPCRKNFMLVITAGNLAGSSGSDAFDVSSISACSSSADDLVKNTCFGKNSDLRPEATKPGTQYVTTFIVDASGSIPTSTPIMEEAAVAGGSKKLYGGGELSGLASAMENAISDILSQATSGTAVSVLTTSSRNLGSLLQAYFLPATQDGARTVTWTGFMQNLWMDQTDSLREDTVSDRQLELSQDYVIKLFFDEQLDEAKVGLFTTDSDGTGGSLSTCTPVATQPFADLKPIFEAGKMLAQKDPSKRQIFTAETANHGGTITTTGCASLNLNCFTNTEITAGSTLETALNADTAPSPYTKEKIIRYVRGECLESSVMDDTPCNSITVDPLFRDRRVTVDNNLRVWKLGDIVNATPKTLANTPLNSYHVDYGDISYYQYVISSTYKERPAVSFVGANDGMLHAFRTGYLEDRNLSGTVKAKYTDSYGSSSSNNVGEEMWAYIPYNAFPYLKYLADPDYCHIYFNDLSVKLFDASVGGDPDDPRPPDGTSWKSILVGGMRFGGACDQGLAPAPPLANVGFSAYYAIDVTDPEAPIPLWEFSAPDLGYATTTPGIVRTGLTSGNGNWYVVVGSGSTQLPGSLTDVGRDRIGGLFFIDLRTGVAERTVSLSNKAIVGDILSIDADKEYRSEKVYFGTSYQVTPSAANPMGWAGTLSTVAIPEADPVNLSTTLTLTTLFEGDYPMTASPDAAVDGQAVWVYAGSGKYHSDLDEADQAEQIFLGMIDPNTPLTSALTTADIEDRTNVVTTGTIAATAQACLYDAGSNTFGSKTVVTEITPTGSAISPAAVGWYIQLTDGERVITKPVAVGGLVDFLSYSPNPDVCKYSGSTSIYSVGYTTGVAPTTVALLTPDVITDSSGNIVTDLTNAGEILVQSGYELGPGAPPSGEGIIISQPGEGEDTLTKHIQLGTVAITNPKNQPPISVSSQIQHWLKK